MSKLLTRQQAAAYIGIDPKTFDKVFRANPNFARFPLSPYSERYTIESINAFIQAHDKPVKQF